VPNLSWYEDKGGLPMGAPAGWDDPLAQRIRALQKIRDRIDREIEHLRGLQGGETHDHPPIAPSPPAAGAQPLRGLKLAVVGPSFREQTYRNLLEPLGAAIIFAASNEKLGRVYRACQKAHGIIFITTFGSHAAEAQAESAAQRSGCPMVRLSARGLDRLKETALTMAGDMAAFKDLYSEVRQNNGRPTASW
jgi:hypothetical protein